MDTNLGLLMNMMDDPAIHAGALYTRYMDDNVARLEAIEDLAERQAAYERMVDAAYNRGKGLNAGHVFEVDDVVDPADTRRWLVAGMQAGAPLVREPQLRTPIIDAW